MKEEFILKVLRDLYVPEELINHPTSYAILAKKILSMMHWYENDVITARRYFKDDQTVLEQKEHTRQRMNWFKQMKIPYEEAMNMRILQDFEQMSQKDYLYFLQYLTNFPTRVKEKYDEAIRSITCLNGIVTIDESRMGIQDICELVMCRNGFLQIKCTNRFPGSWVSSQEYQEPRIYEKEVVLNARGVQIGGLERIFYGKTLQKKYRYNPRTKKYEEVIYPEKIIPFVPREMREMY